MEVISVAQLALVSQTLSRPAFDTAAFLAHAGLGRRIVQLEPNSPWCK
jgi:hypothetical protein